MDKLEQLAEIEGLDEFEMLEQAAFDSVCPGICMNEDCDYSIEVEPDQTEGYCENCQENSVQSCLIIAGLI